MLTLPAIPMLAVAITDISSFKREAGRAFRSLLTPAATLMPAFVDVPAVSASLPPAEPPVSARAMLFDPVRMSTANMTEVPLMRSTPLFLL
jgi:hypothetical protein